MIDPRVASGLRDLPPSVAIPRERMLQAFRRTFAAFGYAPIETPHIERMEVLTGKGAGSDEVLRQIFEVTNKGGTPGELAPYDEVREQVRAEYQRSLGERALRDTLAALRADARIAVDEKRIAAP